MAKGATKAIAALRTGVPTQFDPAKTKLKGAKIDAVIEYARRVNDWPLLENAVDEKIEEQAQFVAWWKGNVTPNKGGDRKSENQIRRTRDLITLPDAEEKTGIKNQQVSRWAARLKNPARYRALLITAAYKKAQILVADNHRARGTGHEEWYTPAEYVEKARAVLGEIDLDPASTEFAQEFIQAKSFFTRADDGLAKEWHGRIWLNPPYTQPDISNFVYKLVGEIEAHRTRAAILLTHNYTDTDWFHRAAMSAALICFTKGRIHFVNDFGETGQPTQGQAFFYFGHDEGGFRQEFKDVGFIR